ncbi:MAG: biotin/lipoyl-binding protein [Lachnospiraceae bacterium]|nr:biotin/lipoyl-binding protein [Lachnospiraceae bacterium]
MKKTAGKWKKWKKMIKKKKTMLLLAFIAGAGLVSFGIYSVKGTPVSERSEQGVSIQEVQATMGTISNTIVGTGTLALSEGQAVTIPSGIVVEEIKVQEGDNVAQGDVLATVNQTSVLRAMENIQEEIEALDEEIEDSKDEAEVQEECSNVDGRIKKIFVQEGQDISECMVEYGALMLVSLDGYLALEIQTDAELAKGDDVIVIQADGTQKEGTIESISSEKCTILVTDSGIGMGENLTVTDSDGNVLGSGSTYIHQQLAITAPMGTVEELCVSEDEKVSVGTTLLTIDNGGQSLTYQEQMAERQELAQELQALIALSQTGTVTAQTSGIIQSVHISAEGSQSEGNAIEALQMSKKETIVVGSGLPNSEEILEPLCFAITDSGEQGEGFFTIETPKTGEKPQTKIEALDGSYHGTIVWNPEDVKFAADISYQAGVTLYAAEGYCFTEDSISKVKTGVISGITVSEDGKELKFHITYPFTKSEDSQESNSETGNNQQKPNDEENGTNSQTGDDQQNGNHSENENEQQSGTDSEREESEQNKNDSQNKTSQQNGGAVGIQNGVALSGGTSQTANGTGNATQSNSSGKASTTGVSQSTTESENSQNTDTESGEVTAFTMAESDTMILTVNVDELDINSVSKEQQAEIALDAIEGESFTGTVAKIGSSASSSGGVAKYAVELTVLRDERMKAGMNASATITIEKREDVVTIPVNALQERGNHVFLYTETDNEGNLSGEQEVTTGLSDADTVEIVEGLSEGDTVYYQKRGNLSGQGFDRMNGDFGERAEEMFQKGPGGSMGEMPQGGFPSGDFGGKRE